jgi:hypothetical protein
MHRRQVSVAQAGLFLDLATTSIPPAGHTSFIETNQLNPSCLFSQAWPELKRYCYAGTFPGVPGTGRPTRVTPDGAGSTFAPKHFCRSERLRLPGQYFAGRTAAKNHSRLATRSQARCGGRSRATAVRREGASTASAACGAAARELVTTSGARAQMRVILRRALEVSRSLASRCQSSTVQSRRIAVRYRGSRCADVSVVGRFPFYVFAPDIACKHLAAQLDSQHFMRML